MTEDFPQTYIILDALDECAKLTELLDILEVIVGWGLDKLHVLVTSRRERDIASTLESFVDQQHCICPQSELVDHDIQVYVRQRLLNDRALRKWQKDNEIQ